MSKNYALIQCVVMKANSRKTEHLLLYIIIIIIIIIIIMMSIPCRLRQDVRLGL